MAHNDIFEALLDIDIPTSFCHTPDDRVVTIDNLPSANDMSTNSNLKMYNPPSAFLRPTGNHFTGAVACAIDPILTYRITNFVESAVTKFAKDVSCPRGIARVCYPGTHHGTSSYMLAPGATQGINDDSSSDIRVVVGFNGLLMSLVGLILATVVLSLSIM
jgi:hypothetical protein